MAEARLDLIRKNINHSLKTLHERDSPGFSPEACGIQSLSVGVLGPIALRALLSQPIIPSPLLWLWYR